MASHGSITINTNSPKDGKSEGSPKGGGQCLCSPTTHQGSFRCRFHRTASSSPWTMKRSKSMPSNQNSVASDFSPKSVESST